MTRPWARTLLGVVCAVVGVLLTLRPFASLDALVWLVAGAFFATGLGELLAPRKLRLLGLGWIAAGVAVLAWAGSTIHALTIVLTITMKIAEPIPKYRFETRSM